MIFRHWTTILIAEDEPDYCNLLVMNLEIHCPDAKLRVVADGQELMDYLCRREQYADPATSPRPDLILLDIYMPRKSGLDALSEIKADPELRPIPVVILTGSREESDIAQSYDLGATSYISKPLSVDRLNEVLARLSDYWVSIVQLPSKSPLR